MQAILAPSSRLFPVEEAEASDCEQQTCDKFDKQLVELHTGGREIAPSTMPVVAAQSSSKSRSRRSCLPDFVIDCTCLDPRRKPPTRLYYCCCLNLRCSVSACRAFLFVLTFGLISAGVAAAAGVTIWGIAVGRTEVRNYGLAGFAGGLLVLIYVCCVASQCQASRKTRELRELAMERQMLQAAMGDRQQQLRSLPSKLSSNCLAASGPSQLSLRTAEEAQQQQQQPRQPQAMSKPKTKQSRSGKASTAAAAGAGAAKAAASLKMPTPSSQSLNAMKAGAGSGGDFVRLPPAQQPPLAGLEPVIFDLAKF